MSNDTSSAFGDIIVTTPYLTTFWYKKVLQIPLQTPYTQLNTEAKTVVGALNELAQTLIINGESDADGAKKAYNICLTNPARGKDVIYKDQLNNHYYPTLEYYWDGPVLCIVNNTGVHRFTSTGEEVIPT